MNGKKNIFYAIVGVLCVLVPLQAQAGETFGFRKITNNPPSNVDVASQLKVEVSDAGSGKVLFKFTNEIGIASSITDVYFDNRGGLFDITASPVIGITSSVGVAFGLYASPGDLSGGNPVGFAASEFTIIDDKGHSKQVTLSADSKSDSGGVSANGVNSATEWLGLTLTLAGSNTYNQVIAALNNTAGNGPHDFWIGMHVQSIGDNSKSDGFVSIPGQVVPAPGAILLGGIGTALVGVLRRRKHL